MTTMSRAVVLSEPGAPISLLTHPVPVAEAGAAVVRPAYGGICGTDVHLQQGRLRIPTPVVLGHEGVGWLEQRGEGVHVDITGAPLEEGARVTWGSSIPCGHCAACFEGARTLCDQRRVYGVNQRFDVVPGLSGSWADRMYLQPGTAIVKLPDDVSFEEAIALGCAGPTVVHGLLRRADVSVGDTVVILGSGPVGLAAALYAKASGARRVVLVGAPQGRLDLAMELAIADATINIEEVDVDDRLEHVLEASQSDGADIVVECAGAPEAVAQGIDYCRRGAQLLVLGQYTDHGTTPINPHLITRKQLLVIGSWAFSETHVIQHVAALSRLAALCDLTRLLTVYGLEDANRALGDVAAGRVTKAVLRP